MPKVSVLMGTYNCAETVGRSIEAIIGQTFENWEMIICDDASTDETFKIVLSYAEKDPRIKVIINEKNYGLSYSLNRCIELATGEYCARMDGDDVCDTERFQKQVDFLDRHREYGFVSTTMKRFDENGIYQNPPKGAMYSPQKRDFVKGSPFCHAPAMLRKTSYERVQGYRDKEWTRGVEDYDLWFRLYANDITGCVINEPLYSMFDGRDAAGRRTFKRRMNEARVRMYGYRMLGISKIYFVYVLKPIVIGLIPQWIYKKIR